MNNSKLITKNSKLNFLEFLSSFAHQKIAVIGDLILDKYIYGEVERISPEAPVPIVRVLKEKYVPGGAANVAANISTLGGDPFLFGTVGKDQYKDILLQKIADMNIPTSGIFTDNNKITTRKTRVIGLNQQLLRIDNENIDYIETHQEEKFIDQLKNINDLSAILISDYAKGTITKQLISQLIQFSQANNIPIIIDPKPKHQDWYTGSTLVTPNKKEAQEMCGIIIETEADFIKAGELLVNKFNSNVIITAGAEGMYIFEKPSPLTPLPKGEGKERNIDRLVPLEKGESKGVYSDRLSEELLQRHSTKSLSTPDSTQNLKLTTNNLAFTHIPTVAREVYDVSGAGDTVIAVLALALCCDADLESAAILANQAAGIKVSKIGTAPIFLEELLKEFQEKK